MNLIVPCIHGDPSKPKTLESWTRRLLVVEKAKKALKKLEKYFFGFSGKNFLGGRPGGQALTPGLPPRKFFPEKPKKPKKTNKTAEFVVFYSYLVFF